MISSKLPTVFIIHILLLINSPPYTEEISLTPGDYTDYCRRTEDCDPELICWESRCSCDHFRGFKYHHILQKCLIDAGNKCYFPEGVPPLLPFEKHRMEDGEDSSEVLPCTEGTFCDKAESHLCLCENPNMEPNAHGVCKVKFGSPCNEREGLYCNEAAFLLCFHPTNIPGDGICKCHDPINQYYEPAMRKCVGRIGRSCDKSEWMSFKLECGPNARCADKSYEDVHFGTCQCNPGHSPVAEADILKCRPSRGIGCTPQVNDCSKEEFLTCNKEGLCECNHYLSQFDPISGTCGLKVSKTCQRDAECYRNSWCPPSVNECHCEFGYEENSEGICRLPFGATCSIDDDLCNEDKGLQCEGTKCECQYDFYDVNGQGERFCSIPAEEECIFNGTISCTANAECVKVDNQQETGVCKCSDYFEHRNGRCVPEIGAPCNSENGDFCKNGEAHFECIDGFCFCDNISVWDEVSSRCRLKIDESCGAEDLCIKNAYCYDGICKCDSERGFTRTIQGDSCELDFEQSCEEEGVCNESAHLVCSEGRCRCDQATRVFDTERRSCVSLAGGECNPREYSWCIEKAECIFISNLEGMTEGRCSCIQGFQVNSTGGCSEFEQNPWPESRSSKSSRVVSNLVIFIPLFTFVFLL